MTMLHEVSKSEFTKANIVFVDAVDNKTVTLIPFLH